MRAKTIVAIAALLLVAACDSDENVNPFGVFFGLVVLVAAPLLSVRSVRKQWRNLPAELTIDESGTAARDSARNRLGRAWVDLLEKALARARTQYQQNAALAAALNEAGGSLRLYAAATETLAIEGANSGQLQSWLGVSGGCGIYILIFPGRHEQPSAFRAHPGFSAGWLRHIESLRARLASEQQTAAVLALVFLVPPDARRGDLVVSYDDGQNRVVSSVMLDAQEIATPGWTILYDRIPLDFERVEAS